MSIVSANKNKIKVLAQDGNKKAVLLQKLLEEPNKFLSTIQVAITLAGFLASASAAVALSDDLGAFLTKFGIPYGNQIAVVLVTMILSYITLVLGEALSEADCASAFGDDCDDGGEAAHCDVENNKTVCMASFGICKFTSAPDTSKRRCGG